MKAISIRAPWAWLIVRPDITDAAERQRAEAAGLLKTVENRTWRTKHRGPVLIHASAQPRQSYNEARWFLHELDEHPLLQRIALPPKHELARGGIIGVADLVDCVERSDSPWYMGSVGFVLANIRPLPFTRCQGQLQLFEVPDEEVAGLEVMA